MRLWMAALLTGAMALPLAACNRADEEPAPRKVYETPDRKAGLWKQTTTAAGMGDVPTVHLCLDAATDKKMAWWGQQGMRANCPQNEVTRNADGSWSFQSVCESPGGTKTTTKGQVSGDFQARYHVEAQNTTVGAPRPEMNGSRAVTMDAEWVGECPANMRPGDLQLPDGSLVNMVELTGG